MNIIYKPISIGCIFNGSQSAMSEELQLIAGESAIISKIDPKQNIEEQGEFDLIIHKPVKYIAEKMITGEEPKALKNLREYEEKHPNVLLDPLKSLEILGDRERISKVLEDMNVKNEYGTIKVPEYVAANTKEELESIIKKGFPLKFPVVCKPFVADGNDLSHQCALAHNIEGILEMSLPSIFQEFHNHCGVLYKGYILGDQIYQLTRPSLGNYDSNLPHPNLEFFGRISNARENGNSNIDLDKLDNYPAEPLVLEMVKKLRSRIPITLFGIDLIRESETGVFYLIDINYFPGYYGVQNLQQKLLSIFATSFVERNK